MSNDEVTTCSAFLNKPISAHHRRHFGNITKIDHLSIWPLHTAVLSIKLKTISLLCAIHYVMFLCIINFSNGSTICYYKNVP